MARCCENCTAPCAGEFKKVVDLQYSGLVIYLHTRRNEQKKAATSKYDDTYVLHNTGSKQLQRHDYITELHRFKPKCVQCKTIVQKVRCLLNEMEEIKENQIVGVCEYCKRANLNKCKRCEFIVSKFISLHHKIMQEKKQRFKEWLCKVKHLLQAILDGDYVCQHRVYKDAEFERILQELKKPFSMRDRDIDLYPPLDLEQLTSLESVSENKDKLEELLSKITVIEGENFSSEASLYPSKSKESCLCKYLKEGRSFDEASGLSKKEQSQSSKDLLTHELSRGMTKEQSQMLTKSDAADIEMADESKGSPETQRGEISQVLPKSQSREIRQRALESESDHKEESSSRQIRQHLPKSREIRQHALESSSRLIRQHSPKSREIRQRALESPSRQIRQHSPKSREIRQRALESPSRQIRQHSPKSREIRQRALESPSRQIRQHSPKSREIRQRALESPSRQIRQHSPKSREIRQRALESPSRQIRQHSPKSREIRQRALESPSRQIRQHSPKSREIRQRALESSSRQIRQHSPKSREIRQRALESPSRQIRQHSPKSKEIRQRALESSSRQIRQHSPKSREIKQRALESSSRQIRQHSPKSPLRETRERSPKSSTSKKPERSPKSSTGKKPERSPKSSTFTSLSRERSERSHKEITRSLSKSQGTEKSQRPSRGVHKEEAKVLPKKDVMRKAKAEISTHDPNKDKKPSSPTKDKPKPTKIKKERSSGLLSEDSRPQDISKKRLKDLEQKTSEKSISRKKTKDKKDTLEDADKTDSKRGKSGLKKKSLMDKTATEKIKYKDPRMKLRGKERLPFEDDDFYKRNKKHKNEDDSYKRVKKLENEDDSYKRDKKHEKSGTNKKTLDKTSKELKENLDPEGNKKKHKEEKSKDKLPDKKVQIKMMSETLLLKLLKDNKEKAAKYRAYKERQLAEQKEMERQRIKQLASLLRPSQVKKKEIIIQPEEELSTGSILVCNVHEQKSNIMVKGKDLVPLDPHYKDILHEKKPSEPLLFKRQLNLVDGQDASIEMHEESIDYEEMFKDSVFRYRLSDKEFIDKGITLLPKEKIMRRMNIYKMEPVNPQFAWFERHKDKKVLFYDNGEKLADIDSDGRGCWYYRNGAIALDYYNATESKVGQRYVVYSSGEEMDRGRLCPRTVLALFDVLGNGILYDHHGNIRLKYNQSEGLIVDPKLGPPGRWKWHTLNDPPVLQQVFINTRTKHQDLKLAQFGKVEKSGDLSRSAKKANPEMLAIELDNFVKEKAGKLLQKFKPFQIRMKAVKLNEQFAVKIMDQANINLFFRDGNTNLKLNLGLVLKSNEIIDTETSDMADVATPYDQYPARTNSVENIHKMLKAVKSS